MTKEQWNDRLRRLDLPAYNYPYSLSDDDKEAFLERIIERHADEIINPRSPVLNRSFARRGPLADYTGAVGREAWRATSPIIKETDEFLAEFKDKRVLADLAARRPTKPTSIPPYQGPRSIMSTGAGAPTAARVLPPVSDIEPVVYPPANIGALGGAYQQDAPGMGAYSPTPVSFAADAGDYSGVSSIPVPSVTAQPYPWIGRGDISARGVSGVPSDRGEGFNDPFFPTAIDAGDYSGVRSIPVPSVTAQPPQQFPTPYDAGEFAGISPFVPRPADPLTIRIQKEAEKKKDLGLTSFSDRLKALDIQGINAVLPYPTMSAGVTRNRKKLQRQRDTFRALMDLNPVDMVWSDNISTSQMEDRWTRRRKQYMSKLLQLTRPQSRSEVNAVASAAGLDTDEWKEMLEVFDSSRQDLSYKQGQLAISELLEKGLIKEAAREFMTGLSFNVIQDADLFAREVHLFQQINPLASGTDFVNEVEKQLSMVRNTPDDAELVTLTDSEGVGHMGYVTHDSKGVPRYFLSEGNKRVDNLAGWSLSSPHATKVETQVDVSTGAKQPNVAQQINLAQGAVRNINYALDMLLDSKGDLKVGPMTLWQAGTDFPNSKGRLLLAVMSNAFGDALRMETGAAIAESEVENIKNRYMPKVLDSDETRKYKIREFWTRATNLIQMVLPDYPIPSPVWDAALVPGNDLPSGDMSPEQKKHYDALAPGSFFQTNEMREAGVMGRKPGDEMGF